MRRLALAVAPALVGLVACGGSAETPTSASVSRPSSSTPASSGAAPQPTTEPTSSSPDVMGATFVDVVDDALVPYAALIDQSIDAADLGAVLPSFDGDVPLPGGTVVGAGRVVEEYGDVLDSAQVIGIDTALTRDDLDAYGASAPTGWTYNSITTTDTSMDLVMTRDDGLRVVYASRGDAEPRLPIAEFRVESDVSEMPQPAWLAALPVPSGGEVTEVGEGVGRVEIDSRAADSGLVTARWRFPVEQLESLAEFYASGALEDAGFALVDPDATRVGAFSFDVSTGEWTGQVIVGEAMAQDESFAEVLWVLVKP